MVKEHHLSLIYSPEKDNEKYTRGRDEFIPMWEAIVACYVAGVILRIKGHVLHFRIPLQ